MCPTPPTGRYIVPTHPAEPSGGGGATAHSGLSRTGPYCGPADMAISPFFQGCTFGDMPRCQISADSSAQRLPRLKVHRRPPIVGPYPVRVPRRDWRSRYVGTPPLRHPPIQYNTGVYSPRYLLLGTALNAPCTLAVTKGSPGLGSMTQHGRTAFILRGAGRVCA